MSKWKWRSGRVCHRLCGQNACEVQVKWHWQEGHIWYCCWWLWQQYQSQLAHRHIPGQFDFFFGQGAMANRIDDVLLQHETDTIWPREGRIHYQILRSRFRNYSYGWEELSALADSEAGDSSNPWTTSSLRKGDTFTVDGSQQSDMINSKTHQSKSNGIQS